MFLHCTKCGLLNHLGLSFGRFSRHKIKFCCCEYLFFLLLLLLVLLQFLFSFPFHLYLKFVFFFVYRCTEQQHRRGVCMQYIYSLCMRIIALCSSDFYLFTYASSVELSCVIHFIMVLSIYQFQIRPHLPSLVFLYLLSTFMLMNCNSVYYCKVIFILKKKEH